MDSKNKIFDSKKKNKKKQGHIKSKVYRKSCI